MSRKSIAKLTFACFLSACYYSPSPIVIVIPGGSPAGSGSAGTGLQDSGPGTGPSTTTVVGNCYYTITNVMGSITEKCRYSVKNPFNLCNTYVAECTSSPPSGKCSLTSPVATC
jgi:hypothetical protein